MDKKILFRLIVAVVALAAAVMWLLKMLPATADYFTWFSLAWAVTMVGGALAVKYLLAGILGGSSDVVVKKLNIWFGAGFAVVTLFCLTWAIAMPQEMIAPIIAIIITGALFLGILFTGGRKWDTGDNQKVGYQNYRQRKAAEEKNAAEQDNAKH